MKMIEVEWVDSVSEGHWQPTEDAIREATREAMLHRSIGYLVHEDEDLILLAGGRSEDSENICDTMQIPKVAVLSIHDLEVKTE